MEQETLPRESRGSLLGYFAQSLASFQDSQDAFRVVCTLPADAAGAGPSTPVPPTLVRPPEPVRRLVILDSSFNPPTVAHMQMALSAAGAYEGGATRVLLLLSVRNADKGVQPASFPHRLAMMYVFAADLSWRVRRHQQTDTDTGTDPTSGTAAGRGVEVDLGLSTLPYFSDKCEAIAKSGHYSASRGTSSPMEQIYLAGYDTLIRIFDPKYYAAPPAPTDPAEDGSDPGASGSMQSALGPFFDKARLRITIRRGDEWGGETAQRRHLKELADGGLAEVGGRAEWAGRVELVENSGEGVVSSTLVRRAAREADRAALRRMLCSGVMDWVLDEKLYTDASGQ